MRKTVSSVFLALLVATSFGAPKHHHHHASDPTVYITRTGHKYHVDGCRYLSHSQIAIKLSEAKREGYAPCKICEPPK